MKTIYHLIPNQEIQQHEASWWCQCGPDLIAKNPKRFWLTPFIGNKVFEHQRISPKTDERLCAVGEAIPA